LRRYCPSVAEKKSSWELERLISSKDVEAVLHDKIEEFRIRCFSVYPDHEISGIGGECPETLSNLDELMQSIPDDETAPATDNPVAD